MQVPTFNVETQYVNYNKIFLLSDTHFGVRANSLEWLNNHQSFFRNFYIPYLKKNVNKNDILFFWVIGLIIVNYLIFM